MNGGVTPESEVQNGLSQGCTLVLTHFKLYFNLVIEQWMKLCKTPSVGVLYIQVCTGKLVGKRTRLP